MTTDHIVETSSARAERLFSEACLHAIEGRSNEADAAAALAWELLHEEKITTTDEAVKCAEMKIRSILLDLESQCDVKVEDVEVDLTASADYAVTIFTDADKS